MVVNFYGLDSAGSIAKRNSRGGETTGSVSKRNILHETTGSVGICPTSTDNKDTVNFKAKNNNSEGISFMTKALIFARATNWVMAKSKTG